MLTKNNIVDLTFYFQNINFHCRYYGKFLNAMQLSKHILNYIMNLLTYSLNQNMIRGKEQGSCLGAQI